MAVLRKGMSRIQRETIAQGTKDMLGNLMRGLSADPIALCEIVAAGPFTWRTRFIREFGGGRFAVDEHIADLLFKFFCERVTERFGNAALADATAIAGNYLDTVEVATPLTEKEIDESWKLTIAGSEDAMRQHYEGSARERSGPDLGFRNKNDQVH